MGLARRLDGGEPDEAADAVVGMHHKVPHGEARHFRQDVVSALAATLADKAVAENILLADHLLLRTRRSPRISCSPITASPGASKPVSSGSTAMAVTSRGSRRMSAKLSTRLVSPMPCSDRSVAKRSRAPLLQQATITRLLSPRSRLA